NVASFVFRVITAKKNLERNLLLGKNLHYLLRGIERREYHKAGCCLLFNATDQVLKVLRQALGTRVFRLRAPHLAFPLPLSLSDKFLLHRTGLYSYAYGPLQSCLHPSAGQTESALLLP